MKLHTHTPVISVVKFTGTGLDAKRKLLLCTPRGPILCSHVVHATNAYASYLLPTFSGPDGIVPTRGQVIATRASVGLDELKKYSWRGNQVPSFQIWVYYPQAYQCYQDGFAYWFPWPLEPGKQNPLVILGGMRSAARPSLERFIDDDSTVNPVVGKALRDLLPIVFKDKFEQGREPEMEWVKYFY